jgi:hypothetical protein
MTREPGDRPEHVILPACGARAWGGLSLRWQDWRCLAEEGRHGSACEIDSPDG